MKSTENLQTEKYQEEDFDLYFMLTGNEQVMAMITERAIPQQEAEQNFEKIIQNNKLHPDLGTFKITDKNSGDFIGQIKLAITPENKEEAELGYMLLPKYWGKGITGLLAKEFITGARNIRQLKKLTAIIDPANTASKMILLKNGFESREFKDFDGLPGEILELTL